MDTEQQAQIELQSEPELQDEALIPEASFAPPTLTPGQFKQLELLQHLALYSELLIVITGEEGAGKSFLCKALAASREEPDFSLLITADFMLGLPSVLQQIAQAQDLPDCGSDVSAALNALAAYCQHLVENDQSFLLVVDQADQMDAETLQALCQLAIIAPANFHVALVGRPSLEHEVLSLAGEQPPVHVMALEAMGDEEATAYLLEQFPEEDWSDEQLAALLNISAGRPGLLSDNAQKIIEGELPADLKQASSAIKFPITHLSALLLVASALLVSFLYSETDDAAQVESASQINPSIESPMPALEVSPAQAVPATGSGLADVGLSADQDAVSAEEQDFNYSPSPAVTDKPAANVNKITPSENSAAAVASASELPVKNPGNGFQLDEAVLMAAPGSNFVIQLFGSHKLESAQAFAKQYRSKIGKTLLYHTNHKQKDWYVVVLGPYVNRAAGMSKVKQLPAKLQAQKPWVRSVASVQKVIKN